MIGLDKSVDATQAPRISALTPYIVRNDFLSPGQVSNLLDYACAHEPQFTAARLGYGTDAIVNRAIRISSTLSVMGALGSMIRDKLRPLAAGFTGELKLQPFELKSFFRASH